MNLQEFCEKIKNEPAFAAKIAVANTAEEVLSLAAEEGFSLTAEELENLPLSDADLAKVSGGYLREAGTYVSQDFDASVTTYGAI